MVIDVLANVAPRNVGIRPHQAENPWGYKPPVGNSDDLQRILALPRREQELDGTPRAEAIIDRITARYAKNTKSCSCKQIDPDRECLTRLRLVQAMALREIAICGGLFGPIGVGHGKTLIDLLAPLALAEYNKEIKTTVLLVPASLVTQLIGDYEFVGQHFHMPSIVFHGNPYSAVVSGAPVVHVVPYSRLCRPEATAWLEGHLKPQAIVADECHKLRNIKTATGHRVSDWMENHEETLFVGMSGSVTSKTPKDYDHLARWALRGGSPLPLDPIITDDWCRAISSKDNPAPGGPLLQLCNPDETLVSGYRRRLAETLGVVTTTAPAIDVTLNIDARDAPPIPAAVMAALNSVRDFVRPDGEELMDALAVGKAAREVACGFYYKWIFPKHVFPRDEALIEDWREARKEYHKEVRSFLKHNAQQHLDSPKLCQNAAERAWGDRPALKGLPCWKANAWPEYRDVKHRVQYESEPVRIDDFLVRDAIAWAEENRGIVWSEHAAFSDWMVELTEGELPYYGGGKNGGGLLGEKGNVLERGDRSLILSIKAHGTGRNGLQNILHNQLIVMLPSGQGCEQVLGRLHRIGQKAPAVNTWFYTHTKEMAKHINDALRDALYVEGTLGAVQKLRVGFKVDSVDEEDSE